MEFRHQPLHSFLPRHTILMGLQHLQLTILMDLPHPLLLTTHMDLPHPLLMVSPLHHLRMTLMDTQLLLLMVLRRPHSMDNHQLPIHMDHPHLLHQPMTRRLMVSCLHRPLMVSCQHQPLTVSCLQILRK